MLLVSIPCSTPSDGGGAKKKGLPFGGNQSSTFESSGEYRGGGACGGSSTTDGSWHTATGGSGLATNLIQDQLPCVLRKFLQVFREIKFSNPEEVTFHIYSWLCRATRDLETLALVAGLCGQCRINEVFCVFF